MRFWKFNPAKYPDRLAHRLEKYGGGQLLLTINGKIVRGEIRRFSVDGAQIFFEFSWLAEKNVTQQTLWYSHWVWKLTHPPIRDVRCAMDIEISTGGEPRARQRTVKVRDFYQNKPPDWKWVPVSWKVPKSLFFRTSDGAVGVLYQLHDPRNLILREYQGEYLIEDPTLPPKKPPL